jgi:predicted GNAT family acetyltransferase
LTDDWPVLQYSREAWDPDFAALLFGDQPQEVDITLSADPTQRALEEQEISRGRRCLVGLRRFLCQDWVPPSQAASIRPRGKLEREVLARMALRHYPQNVFVQYSTQTTAAVQKTLDQLLRDQPDQSDNLWLQARVYFRRGQNPQALALLQHPAMRSLPQAQALRMVVLWESGQVALARSEFAAGQAALDPLDRAYLLRLLGAS